MLRIHFTDADLAQVRVARGPDPCWETVLGLQQLTCPSHPTVYAPWRRRTRAELADRQLCAAAARLTTLAPARSVYFPDFLTPAESAEGLGAALGALRSTPATRLYAELAALHRLAPRPNRGDGWMRSSACAGPRQLDELADIIRALHAAVIEPDWTRVACGVDTDRAVKARALRDGGVHGLLGSLRPMACWRPPVLHVNYPVDRDLHLRGRGLHLIPSYFCWRTAVAPADPDLPPVLVYPVPHDSGPAPRPPALSALLGRTRARVLAALESAISNSELASCLELSAASVSEHTKALREARLADRRRENGYVVHTLTPLGAALLHGELPAGER
ncbi:winged helix-turn-helix domain-containing protein [Streptomyces sp. NPDC051322]|uniref:winged helix-turn-helix domain-containing protein n=1 Tax=Streptomyces sp. NPDC051322 TaxID=3154645 RepID=UPI00344E0F8D